MSELEVPYFPEDFVWGVSSAAYQMEGAVTQDGRGESIWDRFCATPGQVRNGESGAIARDFYHRYRGDIALLRELGAGAFRFSVSWPRYRDFIASQRRSSRSPLMPGPEAGDQAPASGPGHE